MEIMEKAVEYLGMCPSNEDEMLKHIEVCGRRCYKSEHKIDHNARSFEKFYKMLLNNGHMSAIEHSNVVIEIGCESIDAFEIMYSHFVQSALTQMAYFRIMPIYGDLKIIISANVRAWNEFLMRKWWFAPYKEVAEFLLSEYPIVFSKVPQYLETNLPERANVPELEDDLAACGEFTMRVVPDQEMLLNFDVYDEFDIPIYTFIAYTDRGISHEIVRHRVLSYSQESTRYVNYKSNGIQLINWPVPEKLLGQYNDVMSRVEELYNNLITEGVKPQFARNVLPNSMKTEIAMSGRISGWSHFVDLRDSDAAHPDIRFIARYVKETLGLGETESSAA